MSPFQSKSQLKWMHVNKPKIAKEWDAKTNFSKLPEKAEATACSSASGPALFKEDMPKKITVGDVFENNKIKPYSERPIGTRDLNTAETQRVPNLNTAEDDTLMGRFAKRMASRDYIDQMNLGYGTKASRAATAPTADSADLGIPHKMEMYGVAKEKIKEGMEIEKEHTKDPAIQAAIAKDHIKEFPKYYPELKEMENELKGKKEKDD